jgi:hypothetical protein
MNMSSKTLGSVQDTGREMERLVRQYHLDVSPFDDYTLEEFYNLVKKIPYRPDPESIEFVQRPRYTLSKWNTPLACDCDDKAITMGAWLYRHGIPFQFLAVSNRPDKKLHHATLRAWINGKECIIDATYPKNELFVTKPITYEEKISSIIKKEK